MNNENLYFVIIIFSVGITFLLYVISHEFRNINKREWFLMIAIMLIPISICTYVIGMCINFQFNIPKNMQIYTYLVLMLFSAVIPISISYIRRNRNERNQNEINRRLRKLRNNPDISDGQKAQIDAIIDRNSYS